MKNLFHVLTLAFVALWMASCSSTRDSQTTASHEDDEVYYQKGETFISDVPKSTVASSSVYSDEEDEYYDPATADQRNGNTSNNYYGDVYYNNGFGPGYRPAFQYYPRWVMTWSPQFGWYMTYNYGYSPWGMGYNTWNDPWYYNDPWYWNSPWCYNDPWCGGGYYGGYYGGNYWNNPYGYNSYGYNYPWWGHSDTGQGGGRAVVFGHRSPISSNSVWSSSYRDGNLVKTRSTDAGSSQGIMSRPGSMDTREYRGEAPSRFSDMPGMRSPENRQNPDSGVRTPDSAPPQSRPADPPARVRPPRDQEPPRDYREPRSPGMQPSPDRAPSSRPSVSPSSPGSAPRRR